MTPLEVDSRVWVSPEWRKALTGVGDANVIRLQVSGAVRLGKVGHGEVRLGLVR